jgi:formate hydrogenlyase subunit 3/multisubunit Na+/H+ antiporter MnhD subunit
MPGHDFEYKNEDHKIPASCAVPIAVLTVLCVVVGIIPDLFIK